MNNKTVNSVAISLDRKKVQITNGAQGASSIDVSKCTQLGNKSWGAIECLSKMLEAPIVGIPDYKRHCSSAYYDSDPLSTIGKKKPTKTYERTYSGHSFESVPKFLNNGGKGNNNQTMSSEYAQLEAINALQSKFNNHIFRKSDEEKAKLLTMKDKGVNFGNELLYQHSTVKPLKQLSTAEKKARKRKMR